MKQSRRKILTTLALLLIGGVIRIAPAQSLAPRYESPRENANRSANEAARRGEDLRRQWKLDAAEAAFREAIALDSTNLAAMLGLARIARTRFDYRAALRLLDKTIRVNPRAADVLVEYGAIYAAAEETARAREYFDRALQLDPSNTAASLGRATVDLLARDYQSAESRLRAIIVRAPDNSRAHALLARALIETNNSREALMEAERAVALDAYNAEAIGTLAFLKGAERKPDEARAMARRAIALDPFNAGARRLLSQYLDGHTGSEQKVAPDARARYGQGQALKRAGRMAEAVVEFEAALRIEPRYYRVMIALGDVWLREGDYERAATAAQMAITIDPDGAGAHLELSYANRGVQERARLEIGAMDFAAEFYNQPAPPSYALTREIFPDYAALTRKEQAVIDRAVAPLADYLPALSRRKARHYLLAFDQAAGEVNQLRDAAEEKTFDGRYYGSLRGVGGRIAASGLEYIEVAAQGGFHTIAHEFAHQVHLVAFDKAERQTIRRLYEAARREGRALDYYAAANEHEYFAQGYEAFVADHKRPSAGVTARHTRRELMARDPELYDFLMKLTAHKRP
jgi:tetratricopeptide (TPR) repeat protein